MGGTGTILVMAGAREAHGIVARLLGRGRDVIASLPEPERSFGPLPVPTRIGAFPHQMAFDAWMARKNVVSVIDASHAFDADVSHMAALICRARDLRYLRVLRPPWRASRLDVWTAYRSVRRAAEDMPEGARVFSNTGRATQGAFEGFRGEALFLRQTRPQTEPPPFEFLTYVEGTPPFSQGDEEALFRELRINRLICRNVGGSASISKLLAARRLELPVAMIERPAPPPSATVVETVVDALAWEASL
ncbi:precorrin-6A/cobalt-precorrin-6A reductase [Roseobacter sinensis]|uniref:Precorrin-6A/cobalt-precorrin-6A reductase n=1 Tax=Roseobacter sinensis TaxID=2931391 RepID=A0ABT3BFK7_9RHOB|nr:precorrin-6A/cobalt-precorrin-6A reductase [Roseobacter sp. WL0113]MCV3272362.1 precorrin-6A/cobalt-precorrin-6A reductase [Roseobacter sp. WL0113]